MKNGNLMMWLLHLYLLFFKVVILRMEMELEVCFLKQNKIDEHIQELFLVFLRLPFLITL